MLRPGEVIDGRWQLERGLGQGAGGEVWLARDREVGREVALKLGLCGLDPVRLERFRREGAIAASLKHPGIVAIHTSGTWQERPYLAFELVPGARDLRAAARDLPLRERAALVRDAARALAHAHERGVVHRDVKPENLLVDAAGAVRVTDFGLATSEGLSRLTATGAFVGTPSYTAPEQLTGDVEPGPPADVWSLGVVLYEVLTGVLPFQAEGLLELAGRVTRARFTPPTELVPDLDRRLEEVCRAALAPVPSDRYPTSRELADDLDAVLEGRRPRLVPALRARKGPLALAAALVGVGLSAMLWGGSGPAPAGAAPTAPPVRAPGPPPDPAARPAFDLAWRLAPGDELGFELRHAREGADLLVVHFRWRIDQRLGHRAGGAATIDSSSARWPVGRGPTIALDTRTGEALEVKGFPKARGGGIQGIVLETLASDPTTLISLRYLLHVLPGKPVLPGERWIVPLDLGEGGVVRRVCTLEEGPGKGEVTIVSGLERPAGSLRALDVRSRWKDGRMVESIARLDQEETGEGVVSWRAD